MFSTFCLQPFCICCAIQTGRFSVKSVYSHNFFFDICLSLSQRRRHADSHISPALPSAQPHLQHWAVYILQVGIYFKGSIATRTVCVPAASRERIYRLDFSSPLHRLTGATLPDLTHLTLTMPFEHLVPLRLEDWGFFDRQRSVFSSMFKDMGDEWKEFDKDLEKIRSEMFQLKPIDFGSDFGSGFGSDFGKDFGKGFGDLGDFGSSSSRVTSKSTTTTTTKTSSTSSGASPESSLMLKVDRPIVQDSQGNKRLSLRFDCQQFKPEEISVKTVDNRLVVQAKHSEESPGRKVYREFSRQYILPEKIDPLTLNSTLTSDGVLSIEGPAPAGIEAPRERILPIRMLTL